MFPYGGQKPETGRSVHVNGGWQTQLDRGTALAPPGVQRQTPRTFAAGGTVKLSFRLRAKYPIRARTFPSLVYEYYQPEVNAVARTVQLEVRKK